MKSKQPASIKRHSRVGGNLGNKQIPQYWLNVTLLKFHPDWIPAYAGMTEVGCE